MIVVDCGESSAKARENLIPLTLLSRRSIVLCIHTHRQDRHATKKSCSDSQL